jgi:hypothetical protein
MTYNKNYPSSITTLIITELNETIIIIIIINWFKHLTSRTELNVGKGVRAPLSFQILFIKLNT